MRVVFEEEINELAILIPDDGSKTIEIPKSWLPEDSELRDVLELTVTTGTGQSAIHLERQIKETEQRLNQMKEKRMRLLNRNK